MNVILVATITANGQLILTENRQKVNSPDEVLGVFVQKAKEAGNVVMGHATYNMVMQSPAMKEFFSGVEIIVLSEKAAESTGYKVVATPEQAIDYLKSKGFESIVIAGGLQTYNSFLDKDLVTEMYLSIIPVIIADGGLLGTNKEIVIRFKLIENSLIAPDVIQLHFRKA